MQYLLHLVKHFLGKLDIEFNVKKSKRMIIQSKVSCKRFLYNCPQFVLDNITEEFCDSFKYLGHACNNKCIVTDELRRELNFNSF